MPGLADTATEPLPFPVDPFLPAHEDPYPLYRHLRDAHPVLRVPEEEVSRWIKPPLEPGVSLCVVSRYDDVEAILSDWETYSSQFGDEAAGGGLLGSNPPRHTYLRKAVHNAFAPKRVRLLEQSVEAKARELVEALRDRPDADLAQELAWPLSLWLTAELLGIPEADRQFLLHCHVGTEYGGEPELRRELEAYLHALAAERRANPGEDLMSELFLAAPDGALADADAVELCREVFEGGVENPADLICNALVALTRFPDQRALLTDVASDPAALKGAVNELLRFDAPVQRNSRIATRDVELRGVEIPRGMEVMLLFGSANRDDRRFADPDRLDLARPPQRSLAFGHGIHFCLGAPLTRLQASALLPRFVEAFPDYAVAEPIQRPRSQAMRAIVHLPASLG